MGFSDAAFLQKAGFEPGRAVSSREAPDDGGSAGVRGRLDRIVRSVDRLPPFPAAARRILELARDPGSDAKALLKVVEHDPSVTANCLRLCNSSYFGLPEKVGSIRRAVLLLGTENLVRIVLADSGRSLTAAAGCGGYGMRPGELWRHSIGTALLSMRLSERIGFDGGPDLFTAALLHDIGKVVIDRFISDDFANMFSLMKEADFGMAEAEKAYFGIDHAEVGGMIAAHWRFPEPLVRAIAGHHDLRSAEAEIDLAGVTAMADRLCHRAFESDPDAGNRLEPCGLEPAQAEALILEFRQELETAEAFLAPAAS